MTPSLEGELKGVKGLLLSQRKGVPTAPMHAKTIISIKITLCHHIHSETALENYERKPPGRKISSGTDISTLFPYVFTDKW